jgi:hypothetical protein
VQVTWRARFPPIAPSLAVARGACARALARHLGAWPDERLARLAGGAGGELLVVAAPERELPWVDGIIFLGVDPAAPRLRLPTALEPSLPSDLLERLLLPPGGRGAPAQAPLAVLPEANAAGLATIAVGALRPLDRDRLRRFADGERAP